MNKTVQFYNNNLESLIELYGNADMYELYKIITDTLPNGSSLLDIGFGTGRDIEYLVNLGYKVWGVDPSRKFVEYVQSMFTGYQEHFAIQGLPFIDNQCIFSRKFDAVLMIAVLMHIKTSDYENVVKSLANTINKEHSYIVISYSTGKRLNDDRTFYEVDIETFSSLLSNHNIYEIFTTSTNDSLQRDQIHWITKVFKRD